MLSKFTAVSAKKGNNSAMTTLFCIDTFTNADANRDHYLSLQEFQQGCRDLVAVGGKDDNHDKLSEALKDCPFLLHHVFYSLACLCWNDDEEQPQDTLSVKKRANKPYDALSCCPTTKMNENSTQQQLLVRLPVLTDTSKPDLTDQFCKIVQDGVQGKSKYSSDDGDDAYIATFISSSSSSPTSQLTATKLPYHNHHTTFIPTIAPSTRPVTDDYYEAIPSSDFTYESTRVPSLLFQTKAPTLPDIEGVDDNNDSASQMPVVERPAPATRPILFAPALQPSTTPTPTQTPTVKDGIADNDETTVTGDSTVSTSTKPASDTTNNEEIDVRVILGSVLGFLGVCAFFMTGITIYTGYHKQQRKRQITKLKAEAATIPTIISIPSSKTGGIDIPRTKDGGSIVDLERN